MGKSFFVYDIPTKVYFGKNQLENLVVEVKNYGGSALLVYGGGSIKIGALRLVVNLLKEQSACKGKFIDGFKPVYKQDIKKFIACVYKYLQLILRSNICKLMKI